MDVDRLYASLDYINACEASYALERLEVNMERTNFRLDGNYNPWLPPMFHIKIMMLGVRYYWAALDYSVVLPGIAFGIIAGIIEQSVLVTLVWAWAIPYSFGGLIQGGYGIAEIVRALQKRRLRKRMRQTAGRLLDQASSYGAKHVEPGDTLVINFVDWSIKATRKE